MAMCTVFAKAMIENNAVRLNETDLEALFIANSNADDFVEKTFSGIYFSDQENTLIDLVRTNAQKFRDKYKRAIAMSALVRACMKKRARGVFTYTGSRYDDGRLDLHTSLEDHIRNAVAQINAAVFDNSKANQARRGDAMTVSFDSDMVYLDPPYFTPLSDNEYVRRYHFVEGLARGWKGVEIQWHTKTRKFKSYDTPFRTREGTIRAFEKLFKKYRGRIVLVSYSSNSLPTSDEILELMARYNENVELVEIDHRYSFANQSWLQKNRSVGVTEYLFVGH